MSSKKQVYLPGLNAVRFIAAFLVILDHTELFKEYLGFKPLWPAEYSSYIGSFGVSIFFTLSGFLITYLLKEERSTSGNINIKNFYVRRILRIWPLYYLIVALSFFVFPHFSILDVPSYGMGADIQYHFKDRLLLFVFMLPNVAFVTLPTVPFANVLWSVGVEEQFYLFWPVIVKRIKKNIFVLAIFCLTLYMIIKWVISLSGAPPQANALIDRTRFSCMLIGAIAAGCTDLKFLKSKWLQWITLLVFAAMLFNLIQFPFYYLIRNEAQATVIALLLINISMNTRSIFRLENRAFNYLGKISYGLYVYHCISVVLTLKLFTYFSPLLNYEIWSFLILTTVMVLTILLSHISYFYFEKKLLNIKERYSTIISGDQVAPTTKQAVSASR